MKKVDKRAIFGIIILVIGLGVIFYININNTINKNVDEFKGYINNIKEELEECDLGEYEDKYNSLIDTSEKAIDKKDVKSFDYIKEEFEILRSDVKQHNTEVSNEELKEIKKINIEEIDENKKSEIEQQISEAKDFINSGKVTEAKELIEEIKEDINICLQKVKEEKEQLDKLDIDKIKDLINKNEINKAKKLMEEIKKYNLKNEDLEKINSIDKILNKK
ncbi:MAG: hypothetical protein E7214_11615 [Clostridium sp.]|nr:hypothetical protein [Clostridium sp.]